MTNLAVDLFYQYHIGYSTEKKPNREKRTGICGGAGYTRTPTYTPPHSSRVVFFSALNF